MKLVENNERHHLQQNRIKTVALLFSSCCVGCWFYIHSNWPDQYAHLTVCDVGQGDAILIHQGFSQVLIDSSQDDRVLGCLDRFLPPWDRDLDAVIITHYDRDHVGGLASILAVYRIKLLLTSDPPADFVTKNPAVITAITTAINKGMEWKRPILGQQIDLGFSLVPASLELIQALKNQTTTGQRLSENDQSLVWLLQITDIKTLLTGDLETTGEAYLLANPKLTVVDFLKVGHHGAKTSTSIPLLEKIRPKFGLISVGKSNAYGHPAVQTLKNLAQQGVTVIKTSEVGNIDFVFNGTSYWQQ